MRRVLCLRLPNWPQQYAALKPPAREPCDPREDTIALRKLASWCRRYTPIVGLEDVEHPESLLLDITGCAHLFGGEDALARRVLRDVTRLKLIAHVAIADTIGAAWGVATSAAARGTRLPVIVPLCKPNAYLDRLPVEVLRLSAAVVDTLHELDLRTIGQLERLPRETLPSRFGSELLLRLDQALGRVAEQIVPERLDEPVAARWGCEEPIENAQAIEAVLRRLLRRVLRGVEAWGEGIQRLDVWLTCDAQHTAHLEIECVRPTLRRKHLLNLIRLQLERLRISRGVVDFEIRATATAPLDVSQPHLFGNREQRDSRRELDSLLNRLSSRLGRAAVLQPELCADHQPERAVRLQPILASRKSANTASDNAAHRERPLRLWTKPVPVAVTSIVPDGPPFRLRWRNADHRIVHCDGPERIETGWWRHDPLRRDYYRIENDDGGRYWLFRAIDDGRWFLHGEF